MTTAARVLERCDELGAISEEPGRLVRRFATPAMREAHALVAGWMREAGLEVREDAVGNLIGRRGTGRVLALGSHCDTVIDAGRYDGPLGVIAAIAIAERLPGAPLEVISFADEEGLRYGTAFLGSSAVAGTFDREQLSWEDADGVPMRDLVGDPAAAARDDVAAYVELHIEQGPVLERAGVPVGVVTTITGQTHVEVAFTGEAGHAGTVPMDARRDALAAASELVLAAEALARGRDRLVATVGQIAADPGARNVIPGRAALSLDVRHVDDAARRAAVEDLRREAERIAGERGVGLAWEPRGETEAVPADPELLRRLEQAIGTDAVRLPSGAGHDGVAMSAIAPVAMLFVRCERGISHNPAEAVAEADVAVALDVLERFVAGFA